MEGAIKPGLGLVITLKGLMKDMIVLWTALWVQICKVAVKALVLVSTTSIFSHLPYHPIILKWYKLHKFIITIFEVPRSPVPNNGACDWGLQDSGIKASCRECQKYYDPRISDGTQPGGYCVYVPASDLCFSSSWVSNQSMSGDISCTTGIYMKRKR